MLRLAGAELVQVPAAPYRNPNNYVRYSGRLAERLAAVQAQFLESKKAGELSEVRETLHILGDNVDSAHRSPRPRRRRRRRQRSRMRKRARS